MTTDPAVIYGPTPPSKSEVRDRLHTLAGDSAAAAIARKYRRDLQRIDATREQLHQARDWITDCVWREDPEELDELTDEEVICGVNEHYDGGWHALVHAANLEVRETGDGSQLIRSIGHHRPLIRRVPGWSVDHTATRVEPSSPHRTIRTIRTIRAGLVVRGDRLQIPGRDPLGYVGVLVLEASQGYRPADRDRPLHERQRRRLRCQRLWGHAPDEKVWLRPFDEPLPVIDLVTDSATPGEDRKSVV